MKLHGAGFIVTSKEAEFLGLGRRPGLEAYIKPYRNGRDLASRSRDVSVIDLFGLTRHDVRRRFPEVYEHLLQAVRPERAANNRATYRDNWWTFGEPRAELRAALDGLTRYIATVETSKHRLFQFVDLSVTPDNMLVCLASAEAWHLGILSSRQHVTWSLRAGGWLGVGNDPRYSKSRVFDPYPFPDASPAEREAIGEIAEELDATRKEVLAAHGDLTLTGLYNLREKLRRREPFDLVEQDQRTRGRVDIIAELHDRIDAAVARAYGWPADLSDEAVVARLVALNAERRREELAGTVRWLRPAYQIARAGLPQLSAAMPEQIEAELPQAASRKPHFPRDAIGQTAAVLGDLRGGAGLTAPEIARRYAQGLKVERRIDATLQALTRLGHLHRDERGFTLRRAA